MSLPVVAHDPDFDPGDTFTWRVRVTDAFGVVALSMWSLLSRAEANADTWREEYSELDGYTVALETRG